MNSILPKNISEGLLIAAVPVLGYWFAYIFELGYCNYFEIPTYFVEIDIQNVFIAIAAVIMSYGAIVAFGEPLYQIYRKLPSPLKRQAGGIFLASAAVLLISFVKKYPLKDSLYMIFFMSLPFIIADLIIPAFRFKGEGGYIRKLEKAVEEDSRKETITDRIASAIGVPNFVALFLASQLSIFVYFLGGYTASIEKNFIIINDKREMIVLKKYGESFVAASFDRARNKVSPSYSLIPLDSLESGFSYERIEGLIVAKPAHKPQQQPKEEAAPIVPNTDKAAAGESSPITAPAREPTPEKSDSRPRTSTLDPQKPSKESGIPSPAKGS